MLTPKCEEYDWLHAKASVETVEMITCQLIGHLLETHKTQEIFCNLYRRHLGKLHPLYQIMIHHCEGTTPVGALGINRITSHGGLAHNLMNIGHFGAKIYMNEAYKKQHYNDTDFEIRLKVERIIFYEEHINRASLDSYKETSSFIYFE